MREWWSRLRQWVARDTVTRELDEEISYHIEMAEQRYLRAGHAPAEAHRLARVQFGSSERFREEARREVGAPVLEDFLHDVSHALRALRSTPVFTAVAIGSLALGIGLNTAIFSIVDAVLLRPAPYPEPERLAYITVRSTGKERGGGFSIADFEGIRDVAGIAAAGAYLHAGSGVAWRGDAGAEQIDATRVTSGVLRALRVSPVLGRLPGAEDDRPGAPLVVLLGHEFWRNRLAARADVIGATLQLDGEPHQVVGIMPPGFRLPGTPRAELWPILQLEPAQARAPFWLRVVARLDPDASLAAVSTALTGAERAIRERFPESPPQWDFQLQPLREYLVRDSKRMMLVLAGAALLVLLLASANVANLLLGRTLGRAGELSLRSALGAGRGRLVRQLVTESLCVGVAGGSAGLLVAYGTIELAAAFAPRGLAALTELSLHTRALVFALATSLLVGILVGALPALRVPTSLAQALRSGQRTGEGRERARLRQGLVVVQFALAVTLLIGAGLLVSSLRQLRSVATGAAREGVLVVRLSLPEARYPESADTRRFFEQLEERVGALPGVRIAAVSMAVPPSRLVMTNPFMPEGYVLGPDELAPLAEELMVSPGYFDALDIDLLGGRAFTAADHADAPRVVIVNRTLAERYFPGRDPIGRMLQSANPDPAAPPRRIVGVVDDVRYQGLREERMPTVYKAFAQSPWWRTMYLVVRSSVEPTSLVPSIRREVSGLDPEVPLQQVRTMDELMNEAVAGPRLQTGLIASFALLALVLSSAGIYAVMSYAVARRRREASVRMALGARRAQILRLMLVEALQLAVLGSVIGVAVAVLLTRLLESGLYGVEPLDLPTYARAVSILLAVGALAALIPALRAARAEPAQALRAD
jgi:putative ABC transport system permease protein